MSNQESLISFTPFMNDVNYLVGRERGSLCQTVTVRNIHPYGKGFSGCRRHVFCRIILVFQRPGNRTRMQRTALELLQERPALN